MSRPIVNAENRIAGVRKRSKGIPVTRLVGQKMEGHDQKLSPKRTFRGLRR